MSKYTVEQLRELMSRPHNVRNLTVIAHVDHGKSTLTDSLVAGAGIIKMEDAGKVRITDGREDEKLQGITIKSTGLSLGFKISDPQQKLPEDSEGPEFLVNVIDSPGHVDFSSEVTAALRLTDGALVVVDCVEGVCVQTETVVRQALAERVKPALVINKLDRAYSELQLDNESIYRNFCSIISSANVLVSTYEDEKLGDCTLDPVRGNVGFAAGYQGWGFTLNQFAKMYSSKFGVSQDKLVKKLWGENYYDATTRRWSTSQTNQQGQLLQRGFCQFVLEPIRQAMESCLSFVENPKKHAANIEKIIVNAKISISNDELMRHSQNGKNLTKAIMQKWLPAHVALLEMIIYELPSPVAAQAYRAETIYTGPQDDESALAFRRCDPKGPLLVYVSKMIPSQDGSRCFGFGRVFSGTVSSGQKVRILLPSSTDTKHADPSQAQDQKNQLFEGRVEHATVQKVLVTMGKKAESVEDVPAGNTVTLLGIDKHMVKTGTIANHPNTHPIKDMKYSVSPVVKVAVEPTNPADLPKLVAALKKLMKVDPLVQCNVEDTGQHVVAGAGQLHLSVCLRDLEGFAGVPLKVSEPVVTLKETVTETSSTTCLGKSPNKHNRLFCKAEPLPAGLAEAIERGDVTFNTNSATNPLEKRLLESKFGWDSATTKKVWVFNPTTCGPNLVVNDTHGEHYLNEVKDSVAAAFQWVCREGALAEENLRGVRFNVMDVVLHSDAVHRGGGQIIPTARKVLYGCQLTAGPRLMEPVFLVEIQCPADCVGSVYGIVNRRRGTVVESCPRLGTPLVNLKAHLPVLQSFDLVEDLRATTQGRAFAQCVFDHWAIVPGSVEEPQSLTSSLVWSVRKRKGLPVVMPCPDHFLDKL